MGRGGGGLPWQGMAEGCCIWPGSPGSIHDKDAQQLDDPHYLSGLGTGIESGWLATPDG